VENQVDLPVIEVEKPKNATPVANQEIFVIPREAFNYVIVAMVFLIVGTLIGFGLAGANDAENRLLIQQVIAEMGGGSRNTTESTIQYVSVSTDDDPSIGPADAPVTIIEFADYECGFCRSFVAETLPQILTNYEGRVRYIFRDMPILGQTSVDAAIAAECADDQGRYWDYHNALFNNQQALGTEGVFVMLAQNVGIDVNTFNACLSAQTHLGEIVADQSDGSRAGVGGTPAFFINGRYVSGAQSYAVFASIIDQELARIEQGVTGS
jgi:protein-disulfide isomerase